MAFEDLEVSKRAARLSVDIYRSCNALRDYGFRDQITRSSLSVASNIAEGMERDTVPDQVRFMVIARGSIGELRTQIYIGIEIGYIDKTIGKAWADESKALSAMLSGLIRSLRS